MYHRRRATSHDGTIYVSLTKPSRKRNKSHGHLLPYLTRLKRTGRLNKSIFLPIFIGLVLISPFISYYSFVAIRLALRSRPALLYGTPIPVDDVSACLTKNTIMPRSSEKHVLWEWHRNSKPSEGYHKRVLIAQYSGFGEYAKFLNLVSPIHKQYAMERGYDYVILQGTLLEFPGIDQGCNPNTRATFNKIPLLEMAIKEDYDYVL